MSANYPDRSKWLAVRRTPRQVGTRRYVHVSTRYAWVEVEPHLMRFVKIGKGVTYRGAA